MYKKSLAAIVSASLLLAGCSSVYRTAQTPDDVYYSEGRVVEEVATTRGSQSRQADGYSSYWEDQDDDYLRMKVRDRSRWGGLDDIDYWNGFNNGMWVNYNTWNSPWGWNSWNNPWGWNGIHPGFGWNSWNRPFGWNSGWGLGFNPAFGMNNWGFGWNSWANNWNNPWGWGQPVVIINKYPTGNRFVNAPGRNQNAMSPYGNRNFNRSNNVLGSGTNRSATPNRSIWENTGNNGANNRSLYRSVERSGGLDGSNRSFDRPARTFSNGGGSTFGGGSSGGSSGGGSSSSGTSSRGGRGG
jgi:hypothetical protein